MLRRYRLLIAVILSLAIGLPLFSAPTDAASHRTVDATAACTPGANGAQPEVTVKVTNHSGASLVVSYVHGFTTPSAFEVRMTMTDQGDFPRVTIAAGKTRTIHAPWDDLRTDPSDTGGALIITNLGALAPRCTNNPADQGELDLGSPPASNAENERESVVIAAKMLGQLESWRAYPALYALLHPDVQAVVSFDAFACWYADQYGMPDAPADKSVWTTDVSKVTFAPWTWGVTGKQYDNAATATIEQAIGTLFKRTQTTATSHLVAVAGQWRWFFGSNAADLAALPTDCDLGPGAISQPSSGSTGETTRGGSGSITITMYTCPAGMTVESLDPSSCALDPGATTWTLSGSPLDQPLTWADVTQHHGPGYSWDGLSFGEYIITPDALPDGVSEYAVTGSADAARQDTGIALTLGSDDPNMKLNIYLFGGGEQATTGSIEVDFYDCQPGMTPDNFDPSDCSPLPQGFSNYTLTPGQDVPSSALPGGPIFVIVDGSDLGGGRFKIDDLPLGTYEISPGQNYQGPRFYSPDSSPTGDSGIAASTYQLHITSDNLHPVLTLYRLSQGVG